MRNIQAQLESLEKFLHFLTANKFHKQS